MHQNVLKIYLRPSYNRKNTVREKICNYSWKTFTLLPFSVGFGKFPLSEHIVKATNKSFLGNTLFLIRKLHAL